MLEGVARTQTTAFTPSLEGYYGMCTTDHFLD